MNKEIYYLSSNELPLNVKLRIENAISFFSVGLCILDKNNNFLSLASGTLVSVHGRCAILTAKHVIEKIKYNLGLVLNHSGLAHKPVLERQWLEFAYTPSGKVKPKGPDMGLIYINASIISTIKAIKSFFNLDCDVDSIRERITIPTTPTNFGPAHIRNSEHTGVLCVFGLPGEWSDINSDPVSLTQLVCYTAHVYYSERDGYDYFHFDFESPHPDRVPSSLKGMSGGGVWRARVIHDPATERVYVPEGLGWLILSGVIFGEGRGGKSLHTHGPKSVYVKMFEWA